MTFMAFFWANVEPDEDIDGSVCLSIYECIIFLVHPETTKKHWRLNQVAATWP